jgi:hypothetical protein
VLFLTLEFLNIIFRTEYAPGYSEVAYNSIRAGDSADIVFAKLGTPLWTRDTYQPRTLWYDEQSIYVCVDDSGRVLRYSENLPTWKFGSNGLTVEAEVLNRLGTPDRVTVETEVTALGYSQPMDSKSFKMRTIIVDRDRKVVIGKEKYVFHD